MNRNYSARTAARFARHHLLLAGVLWLAALTIGCHAPEFKLIDAFPPAGTAAPWIQRGIVWQGTFAEAQAGLGDEAVDWGRHGPRSVWIGKYCHEAVPAACLTVRCFAFPSPDQARSAYEHMLPVAAESFDIGDRGCTSPIGVMFQTGPYVWDVFGPAPSPRNEFQSALLANHILRRLPPALADPPP